MYKAYLATICLTTLLFLSACSNTTLGPCESESTSSVVSDNSVSIDSAESMETVHSRLLGISFDCSSSYAIDDTNTEPLLIIHFNHDKYMLIGYCEEMPADVQYLPEKDFSGILETIYVDDESKILKFDNYKQYCSPQVEYARLSATIETDYSQYFGTETILNRQNTYFLIRLNTGKMLFAICCDDADYPELSDYTSIIESIRDTDDGITGLKPIDEARLDEIFLLEKTYYGQNE